MSIIRLPIDTKSLYFNIKNDNIHGHTATVATPLKQGNTYNNELGKLLSIQEKKIDISSKAEFVHELIKHSKSKVIITHAYKFDKLSVNGMRIYTESDFCVYVKEEVDPCKVQYGRLKVHYPMNLFYSDEDFSVNNKEVINAISDKLSNYAFLIRAFEYNTETQILNFDALIVGVNGVPYSKVFINEKGVGNKFNLIFNENADDYDYEIISLRKKFGEIVSPSNFLEYSRKMKELAYEILKNNELTDIEIISDKYPYSLFDFIYKDVDGIKKYGILRVTSTKMKYFNMSLSQRNFLYDNKEDVIVFLIVNIYEKPEVLKISCDKLSEFSMSINSIKYGGD